MPRRYCGLVTFDFRGRDTDQGLIRILVSARDPANILKRAQSITWTLGSCPAPHAIPEVYDQLAEDTLEDMWRHLDTLPGPKQELFQRSLQGEIRRTSPIWA